MKIAEIEKEIGDRKVIRHQSKVFFCVYSQEAADHFSGLGATVRKAGGGDELGRNEWGAPCWEVFPVGMLDPLVKIIEDEEVDLAPEFILNHFRQRDGYDAGLERLLHVRGG